MPLHSSPFWLCSTNHHDGCSCGVCSENFLSIPRLSQFFIWCWISVLLPAEVGQNKQVNLPYYHIVSCLDVAQSWVWVLKNAKSGSLFLFLFCIFKIQGEIMARPFQTLLLWDYTKDIITAYVLLGQACTYGLVRAPRQNPSGKCSKTVDARCLCSELRSCQCTTATNKLKGLKRPL